MCVCVCVCMLVCVYSLPIARWADAGTFRVNVVSSTARMHVCVSVFGHLTACICFTCVRACVLSVYVYVYVCMCMFTCMFACVYLRVCLDVYIYMYIYVYAVCSNLGGCVLAAASAFFSKSLCVCAEG